MKKIRTEPREAKEPIPPLPEEIPPPRFLIPARGKWAWKKCGFRENLDETVTLWLLSQCCGEQVVGTMIGNICRKCEEGVEGVILGEISTRSREEFSFELDGV